MQTNQSRATLLLWGLVHPRRQFSSFLSICKSRSKQLETTQLAQSHQSCSNQTVLNCCSSFITCRNPSEGHRLTPPLAPIFYLLTTLLLPPVALHCVLKTCVYHKLCFPEPLFCPLLPHLTDHIMKKYKTGRSLEIVQEKGKS